MEYAKTEWPESELDVLAREWGANILRIPFNQQWALARDGYDPEPYLLLLDRIVRLAAERGAYTLLALQWLNDWMPRGLDWKGTPNFVPPLPDEDSFTLWRQLAIRYRGEPAVMFDILSEPHDPLPDDPLEGAIRRVTMREWQPRATAIIRDIRAVNQSVLIFVSGVRWGYDLDGFPLGGECGLVYSTHVYRNKGTRWDKAFGDLSRTAPVFAGEWGGEEKDLDWGRRLAQYFEEREIGWTAWGWPDKPPLIDHEFNPTPFGELVRSHLRRQT